MQRKNDILKLIKDSVKVSAPDATLIVYGSYARGDYHSDSDVDLLILLDQDNVTRQDKQKVTHPLYDIELSTGVLISPIIYSKAAWANHKITPFYENVNKEGAVL